MAGRSNRSQAPLKSPVLHILLALSSGDRHGLGIADDVAAATEGAVELGPGTLYRSLDQMRDSGLVERVDHPEPSADPRRKYYRITPTGTRLLRAEMMRLERLVERARARRVLPESP